MPIVVQHDGHGSVEDMKFIELIHSGEFFFNRLKELIDTAQTEIHLQTYIFENDLTGNDIANHLKQAAKRGVRVYMLLDAYGSATLPNGFVQDLRQSGIFFRFFSPLFSLNNFHLGRRMHHKVVVADEKRALIGGINIADKYRGSVDTEPWLDYAVYLNCPASKDLQRLCRDYFYRDGSSKKIMPVLHSTGKALVGIRQNDWLKNKTEVCDAYTQAILGAKEEIIIIGSYFLPGRRLANALKKVGKRGVKIKIILAGTSDVPLVRRAAMYLYSSFLGQNMSIFEWSKSVVHGKAAVIDGEWATIGSFNLNSLSCYGSIEMNVEIHSSYFAEVLHAHFQQVIGQCKRITHKTLKDKNSLLNRLANFMAYKIVRMAIHFLTFVPHIRFARNYRH